MKKLKIFLTTFLVSLTVAVAFATPVFAYRHLGHGVIIYQIGNPLMTVDYKVMQTDSSGTVPRIIDGRTYLPLRSSLEAAMYYRDMTENGVAETWPNVSYNLDNKDITVNRPDLNDILPAFVGKMQVGSKEFSTNWDGTETKELANAAPLLVDGRVLIPADMLAKISGKALKWVPHGKYVIIYSDGFELPSDIVYPPEY